MIRQVVEYLEALSIKILAKHRLIRVDPFSMQCRLGSFHSKLRKGDLAGGRAGLRIRMGRMKSLLLYASARSAACGVPRMERPGQVTGFQPPSRLHHGRI